jgi:hypothetical protein
VICKLVEVIIEPRWLSEDGYVDIEAAQSVAISSLDCYHSTQKIGRFNYAKPGQNVSHIEPSEP